jgi:hypothetical protein
MTDKGKEILKKGFIGVISLSIAVLFIISVVLSIKLSNKKTEMENAPQERNFEIVSMSYMQNDSKNFVIQNDGKNYIVYAKTESDGGITLQKYKTSQTTIFKTIPENETPYVKLEGNIAEGVKKASMYVPQNATLEDVPTTETPKTSKEDEEDGISSILFTISLCILSVVIVIAVNVNKG